MTLPKPLAVETGELTGAPPRHDPLRLGPLIRSCVVPTRDAVSIAGVEVRMDRGDPELWAARLRLALHDRFLERHPMADEEVWKAFLVRARGVASSEQIENEELLEMLLRVIDEL